MNQGIYLQSSIIYNLQFKNKSAFNVKQQKKGTESMKKNIYDNKYHNGKLCRIVYFQSRII